MITFLGSREFQDVVNAPVLVVEDDASIREALSQVLKSDGHAVVTASHGAEALERLESGMRPGLIVLDVMMPVMDGPTFVAELRARPEWEGLPVLLLSAARDLEEQKGLDGYRFLKKPVDLEALLRTVGDLLDPRVA